MEPSKFSSIHPLMPENIWKYFKLLMDTPRKSGFEKAVQDKIEKIGKSFGYETSYINYISLNLCLNR
jgi:di/tripeptidase